MRFAKVSTKTLRQQVYDQLRGKIISAGVLPGETLRLRGLADEFGVSLMPVREALWQLKSEKIVLIESKKDPGKHPDTAGDEGDPPDSTPLEIHGGG
jgi:DNA-binding GntR family transcriptional regulator